MYFMFPQDTFCKLSLKSALFPLAQVPNVWPAPITQILKKGRDHWRSVLEQCPRQSSLVMFFAKSTTVWFFLPDHDLLWGKNPSDKARRVIISIHSIFSWMLPIHNGCPGALNLSPFFIYKSLSSCIRQASSKFMSSEVLVVEFLSSWRNASCDYHEW